MLRILIVFSILCIFLAGCKGNSPASTPAATITPTSTITPTPANALPKPATETPKAESGKVSPISSNDLAFVISGKTYKVNDNIDAVVANLGKGYTYSEAPSCDHDGVDKIFKYASVEFNTFPDGKKDIINEIILTDPQYKTSRGITVGQSKDDVIGQYGSDYQKKGLALVYPGNGSSLWFYFKGNTISSISLSPE